jgi:uncharacterized protein YejL (UPF0352 family)
MKTIREILAVLNRHKTKITGAVLVVLGAVQANATALQAALSPQAYAWTMVGAGCFVALLGFLNGRR